MRKRLLIAWVVLCLLAACGPSPAEQATLTAAAWTQTPTVTPTPSMTPTATFTPTLTLTPTVTATPTSSLPTVTVNRQAHCRYGPSTAYLHAADLYPGDKGFVRWRAMYSQWLYVKFDKLNYSCWVAPSVVDVVGDVSALKKAEPDLLSIGSNMYGPPQNVRAVRDGDYITISWERIEMTEDDDRGYLIEAFICQDTIFQWWTYSTADQYETSVTIRDEAGCAAASYGRIYGVEKHGYSQPVDIPWIPAP